MNPHARRTILTVFKIALAVVILGYLLYMARDPLATLSGRTLDWWFLFAAFLFSVATAALSFLRWHILIRALGFDIPLMDSMRLGSLGFALNFVSPGSIGGDFFKAIFLAHGHPGRRTEAVATVLADRVLGLLTMLGLASCGILAAGLLYADASLVRVSSRTILIVTIIGWIGFALLMAVGALSGPWIRGRAEAIPGVGKTLARLLTTVEIYRARLPMVFGAFIASVVMTLCFITSYYLFARGLPIQAPPWKEHVVIVPIAGVVGAIPITPSGMGTMEAAIEQLYQAIPGGAPSTVGGGTLVGVGRRVMDIAIALVGGGFYLAHRGEVREVFAEAEEAADEE